jgi:hypothetical protein
MTRILLPTSSLIGRQVIVCVQQFIGLQQDLTRLQRQLDAITAGGTNTVALEDPAGECRTPVGTGATIYNGVVSMKAAIDGLNTTLANLDQG